MRVSICPDMVFQGTMPFARRAYSIVVEQTNNIIFTS